MLQSIASKVNIRGLEKRTLFENLWNRSFIPNHETQLFQHFDKQKTNELHHDYFKCIEVDLSTDLIFPCKYNEISGLDSFEKVVEKMQ